MSRKVPAVRSRSSANTQSGSTRLGSYRLHLKNAKAGKADVVATAFQRRLTQIQSRSRRVHHENCAIGVAFFNFLNKDEASKTKFTKIFEKRIGRSLKQDLLREVFVWLYGKDGSPAAGTDAMAMRQIVRDGISPSRIPRYISECKGVDALLRAERARKKPDVVALEEESPKIANFEVSGEWISSFEGLKEGAFVWLQMAVGKRKNGLPQLCLQAVRRDKPDF